MSDGRLLELIGDTQELLALDEFRPELLRAVRRAVPAEWVSINDIGPDPASIVVLMDPPAPELEGAFARYAHQNPLVQRMARTRDGRPLRFSDVITAQELHAREIYTRVYRPLGVEFQIAFTLPGDRERILGVALSRGKRDFSDDERDLLSRARPFLIQAYRNAARYTRELAEARRHGARASAPALADLWALGLTARQAEVMQLLAGGAADREIAAQLSISERTVHKHLQRCYRQLGVGNRIDAVAAARSVVPAAGERAPGAAPDDPPPR